MLRLRVKTAVFVAGAVLKSPNTRNQTFGKLAVSVRSAKEGKYVTEYCSLPI